MTYRDAAGNLIEVGDLVAVGAQGIIVGTVQKASSLVSPDPNSPNVIEVAVIFPIPVAQNGLVGGIVKVAQPEKAAKPQLVT